MIVRVLIEPIDKNISQQNIQCSYQFEGKHRMLIEDDSFADYDFVEQKDKPRPYERSLSFNKNFLALEYLYESDPSKQSDQDKKIERAIRFFWGNHPLCVVNGKPTKYTKQAMFNVVNFTDKSMAEIKLWRDVLQVCNAINELSYQEKVNISYYYGQNPQGKTENDLLLTLANYTSGICVTPNEVENFKRIWIKNENSDKDFIINARKALCLSIIEERQYEGKNSYYLGDTFIGTAFNDIVAYCKREELIYQDFIVRQINQKEDFSAEKKESKAQAPVEKPLLQEELKKEARELKELGLIWKGLNIDNVAYESLEKHVIEGRKKKNKESAPKEAVTPA